MVSCNCAEGGLCCIECCTQPPCQTTGICIDYCDECPEGCIPSETFEAVYDDYLISMKRNNPLSRHYIPPKKKSAAESWTTKQQMKEEIRKMKVKAEIDEAYQDCNFEYDHQAYDDYRDDLHRAGVCDPDDECFLCNDGHPQGEVLDYDDERLCENHDCFDEEEKHLCRWAVFDAETYPENKFGLRKGDPWLNQAGKIISPWEQNSRIVESIKQGLTLDWMIAWGSYGHGKRLDITGTEAEVKQLIKDKGLKDYTYFTHITHEEAGGGGTWYYVHSDNGQTFVATQLVEHALDKDRGWLGAETFEASHKVALHSGHLYPCSICGKNFPSPRSRGSHMKAHKGGYCSVCFRQGDSHTLLGRKPLHSRLYRCVYCGRYGHEECGVRDSDGYYCNKCYWDLLKRDDISGAESIIEFDAEEIYGVCPYCGFDAEAAVSYQSKQNDETLTPDQIHDEVEFYLYESHPDFCEGMRNSLKESETFEAYNPEQPRDEGGRWSSDKDEEVPTFTIGDEEWRILPAYGSKITLRDLSEAVMETTHNHLDFDTAHELVNQMLAQHPAGDSQEARQALLLTLEETQMQLEYADEIGWDMDIEIMAGLLRSRGIQPPEEYEEAVINRLTFEDEWATEETLWGERDSLICDTSNCDEILSYDEAFGWRGHDYCEECYDYWLMKDRQSLFTEDTDCIECGFSIHPEDVRQSLNEDGYCEHCLKNLSDSTNAAEAITTRFCPICDEIGLVVQQHSDSVDWSCSACGHQWHDWRAEDEREDRNSPAFEDWDDKMRVCLHDWQDDKLEIMYEGYQRSYDITSYCPTCDTTVLITYIDTSGGKTESIYRYGKSVASDFYDSYPYAAEETVGYDKPLGESLNWTPYEYGDSKKNKPNKPTPAKDFDIGDTFGRNVLLMSEDEDPEPELKKYMVGVPVLHSYAVGPVEAYNEEEAEDEVRNNWRYWRSTIDNNGDWGGPIWRYRGITIDEPEAYETFESNNYQCISCGLSFAQEDTRDIDGDIVCDDCIYNIYGMDA